ncbi:sulfite exporter TauE/SafE family protein [Protaetiibacter mangrovi]|uniref:Probable membrane transporter protein n=1 Tax=Protaetiibacter mangrovi TaxID=2970926 RepID=A0ABT1ZGL8_9MICO|nr:sulfite exporter TauE/SafE family protein [Protaetiibacter mangrovi]MCS0499859.1 sulfite exporter TauE/SafE family protein [Protaetiibacter mangrovi]TPX03593.1 sulfite exporter TauE/SafE family protein [Schumannella luteola]
MTSTPAARPRILLLIGIGVLTGFVSGLFGVGGGIVIVPALVTAFRMDQRRAAATSLIALLPISIAGTVTYALSGQVHLLAALLLAAGSVIGSPIGVRLLHRIPDRVLPWIFVGFIGVVIVSLLLSPPSREGAIEITWLSGAALVGIGLLAGILSGLVGVGGGVVAVPGLEVVVGAGDLLARGTSLAMMIPTTVVGILSHRKHLDVDLRSGFILGGAAVVVTPLGSLVAHLLDAVVGSILFAAFLVAVSVVVVLRGRPRRG